MNILISSLLGVAAFVLQVATVIGKVGVSVWPRGSNIYLGECVLLQCTLGSNFRSVRRYQWFRHNSYTAPTPNPRHVVSGDSYSITAVTREDAGKYWCQADWWKDNTTLVAVPSMPTVLIVSELPPPSLTLTPSTRQIFKGETFLLQCPYSSGWKMMQFSLDKKDLYTSNCPTPGDAVSIDKCEFTVAGRENQLYWCEDTKSRSNTVNITASNGTIILKSPAFPVFAGNKVVLYCQYRIGNHSNATFFKNGREIIAETFFSSSDGVIEMTIENVTLEDEGLYKCASQDRKMESPESWLSVRPARGNFTSTDGTAASTMGSWKWIILFCGIVLLFLILLSVWLICHYRYQRFCTSSCLALPIENLPAVELPATKQDVTEVQWDLSWMEMSSLLDKQLYPGT